jgi:hypothetical protein
MASKGADSRSRSVILNPVEGSSFRGRTFTTLRAFGDRAQASRFALARPLLSNTPAQFTVMDRSRPDLYLGD